MKIMEIWIPKMEVEIYKEFKDWVPMRVITLTRLSVPEAVGDGLIGDAEMTHAVCYNEKIGKIEEYPLRDSYLKIIEDEKNQERITFSAPIGEEGA